jgi:hypothetical protein
MATRTTCNLHDTFAALRIIILVGRTTVIVVNMIVIGTITAISATAHPVDTSVPVRNALAVGVIGLGSWVAGWGR